MTVFLAYVNVFYFWAIKRVSGFSGFKTCVRFSNVGYVRLEGNPPIEIHGEQFLAAALCLPVPASLSSPVFLLSPRASRLFSSLISPHLLFLCCLSSPHLHLLILLLTCVCVFVLLLLLLTCCLFVCVSIRSCSPAAEFDREDMTSASALSRQRRERSSMPTGESGDHR